MEPRSSVLDSLIPVKVINVAIVAVLPLIVTVTAVLAAPL
jgi:hypothetical protein